MNPLVAIRQKSSAKVCHKKCTKCFQLKGTTFALKCNTKKEEGRDKYKKASGNIDKLLFWRESVDGIGLAYSQILQLTYIVWVGEPG